MGHHRIDDGLKSSAYLYESLVDERTKKSEKASDAAFSLAYNTTDITYFEMLHRPGNEYKRKRFDVAMLSAQVLIPNDLIFQGTYCSLSGVRYSFMIFECRLRLGCATRWLRNCRCWWRSRVSNARPGQGVLSLELCRSRPREDGGTRKAGKRLQFLSRKAISPTPSVFPREAPRRSYLWTSKVPRSANIYRIPSHSFTQSDADLWIRSTRFLQASARARTHDLPSSQDPPRLVRRGVDKDSSPTAGSCFPGHATNNRRDSSLICVPRASIRCPWRRARSPSRAAPTQRWLFAVCGLYD